MRNLEPQSTMALVAALDPATVNSTPKYSDIVDTTLHPMLLALFSLGDMVAEAIFLVIERCDSDGSNAKRRTGGNGKHCICTCGNARRRTGGNGCHGARYCARRHTGG